MPASTSAWVKTSEVYWDPASELSRIRVNSDYVEVWVKPRIQGLAWSNGAGHLIPRLNDLVLSEAV
jgi:hypothetical protein